MVGLSWLNILPNTGIYMTLLIVELIPFRAGIYSLVSKSEEGD